MMSFISLVASAFAQEDAVRVAVPSAPVGVRELVAVTVSAPQDADLLLDGCTPIEFEQLVDDVWRPAPGVACRGDERPVRVSRDLTISLPTPGPGTWRAVVVWGSGCHSAAPLAFASCAALGSVRSAPFTVVGG